MAQVQRWLRKKLGMKENPKSGLQPGVNPGNSGVNPGNKLIPKPKPKLKKNEAKRKQK